MSRRINYTEGQAVGDYGCVFIEELPSVSYGTSKPRRYAKFLCSCREEFSCVIDSVKNGKTKSCGCIQRENGRVQGKAGTHGMSKTKIYSRWSAIKRRCYVEGGEDYPLYGGRGIRVCDRWLDSFENFYEDMGEAYQEGLELDRIDVNGDYSPENCRWVDEATQAWNKRVYKTSKTRVSGVTWNKKASKWESRISQNGKEFYLGMFGNIDDAITCRKEAEVALYGQVKHT